MNRLDKLFFSSGPGGRGKGNLLLAFRMKVYPAHRPLDLVEADVVEPLETGAHDLAHAVVRHKEGLFPAHEDVLTLQAVFVVEVGLLG